MSATTLDAIVDRVRAVVAARGYHETGEPFTFDRTPAQDIDGAFRVATGAVRPTGQVGAWEEHTTTVDIWLAARHGQDVTGTAQALRQAAHSLTAALVRDGMASTAYDVVEDGGRTLDVQQEPGRLYTVLRLGVPVSYETTL